MTQEERDHPDILDASRKRRVATGAGMQVSELNQMLKQFKSMGKMLKTFNKMPAGLMRGMGALGGMFKKH